MWCILDSIPIHTPKQSYLMCQCKCGKIRRVVRLKGNLKSQKCNGQCVGIKDVSKLKAYHIWEAMLQRCLNPNCKGYAGYGGRGITVTKEWRRFDLFYRDMGDPPNKKQLDRINNDGGYSKDNCRWVTSAENNKNQRSNINVTLGGRMFCLKDACKILGLNYNTIHHWRNYCKTPEEYIIQQIEKGKSTCSRMLE